MDRWFYDVLLECEDNDSFCTSQQRLTINNEGTLQNYTFDGIFRGSDRRAISSEDLVSSAFVFQGTHRYQTIDRFLYRCKEILGTASQHSHWGFCINRVYSWGSKDALELASGTTLRNEEASSSHSLHCLNDIDHEALLSIIHDETEKPSAQHAALVVRLTRSDLSAPTSCSVTLLPLWNKANHIFQQYIEDLYHRNPKAHLLTYLQHSGHCIFSETVLGVTPDAFKCTNVWCTLTSKAEIVQASQPLFQVIDGHPPLREVEPSQRAAMCLCATHTNLQSELAALASEVSRMKQTRDWLSESIQSLLQSLEDARQQLYLQEMSLKEESRVVRQLLSLTHATAAAEHRSILSQIAAAVDAYVPTAKES